MKDNRTILIIFLSFPLMALLCIFLISKVSFDVDLSPVERKVIYFNYETVPKIGERKQSVVTSLRNPIVTAKSSQGEFPKVPLSELAPVPSAMGNKVSFILINQEKRMAIIDGKFVNEGDIIGNQKVSKIEKDKVLLKNREGEKWLTLD